MFQDVQTFHRMLGFKHKRRGSDGITTPHFRALGDGLARSQGRQWGLRLRVQFGRKLQIAHERKFARDHTYSTSASATCESHCVSYKMQTGLEPQAFHKNHII